MLHRHTAGMLMATLSAAAVIPSALAAPGEPIGATLSVINVVTA